MTAKGKPPWLDPVEMRQGDEFSYAWPDFGVGMGLTALRRDGRGVNLEGDLTIYLLNRKGDKLGIVEWVRLRLNAPRQREDLDLSLRKQFADEPYGDHPFGGQPIDWLRAIKHVCIHTDIKYRAGSPSVALADVPFDPTLAFEFDRFAPLGDRAIGYGDGESGKSLFAMLLAISHAIGQPVADGLIRPSRRGAVLYLDWETEADKHAGRLTKLAWGLGLDIVPKNIRYRRMFARLADDIAAIREEIARYGVTLLIVDSMFDACGNTVGMEEVSAFFGALNSIPGKVTKWLVTHVSAEGARAGKAPANPLGLRQIRNNGRSNWEMRGAHVGDDQIDIALYHRKSNDFARQRPIGVRFRFDPVDGTITANAFEVGEERPVAVDAVAGTVAHTVLVVLRDGPATAPEIAEITGLEPNRVRAHLSRLQKQHLVEKVDPADQRSAWQLVRGELA